MKYGKLKTDPFFYLSVFFSVILIFIIGIAFGAKQIFPYSFLYAGYRASKAQYEYYKMKMAPKFESYLWHPTRDNYLDARGITEYRPGLAYDGPTLYTSGHDQKVFLIDLEGKILHEWFLPLKDLWESEWNHNKLPKGDKIYIRDAYLYPNGDILLLYIGNHNTPWGLCLVMADKDSKIIWKHPARVHHDLDVGPDGIIYSLTHTILNAFPQSLSFIQTPLVDDSIAIFDPNGTKLKEVSILNAFLNSEYKHMLRMINYNGGDFFHANSIDIVTPEISQRFNFTEVGQVLVCLRNIETLVLIDPELEKVTWTMTGPWTRPHDPDFLENGNMMIFDNIWNKDGEVSRIVEFDPSTKKTVWQYQGDESKPFFSELRSRQQALPNGNVLICESDGGRLVEVNRNQEIVWEFVNPVQETFEGKRYISVISTGRRYSAGELNFIQNRGEL